MKGFGLPQEDRQFQNKWRQKVHGQLINPRPPRKWQLKRYIFTEACNC